MQGAAGSHRLKMPFVSARRPRLTRRFCGGMEQFKNELIMQNKCFRMADLALKAFALAALAWVSAGCASTEVQVQKAAKDWCMTIRGGQVIPVYPLTDDVQPGDIFLVQVPIDAQQQLYAEKGFLALDSHLGRINPTGYGPFYEHSFFVEETTNDLPRNWPHAAFPTYAFTVRKGAGMNLAVPIASVPVGLSLLASDAASGTIEIKNAYTIGVDTVSLYRQLQEWAGANAHFLSRFGPSENQTNYLRVVTRVYATGKMSVSLTDTSNHSGGLNGRASEPVGLLAAALPVKATNTSDATLRNYTNAWITLSQIVEAAGGGEEAGGFISPGGNLRLVAASAGSISLDESFTPPLVFGFLGFDCAIAANGVLGAPIPTYAVISQIPVQETRHPITRNSSGKVRR